MAAKAVDREELKTGGVAADRLRSIVDRIERLEEERKALGGDIKDIYSEAKSAGFDVKALRQLIRKVGRPLFQRLLELIGGMLGLPSDDDKTRLCAISVMGQIIAYVFAGPLLLGVWPELKMTPEQVDRIADHIADFSLSYIRNYRAHDLAHSNGAGRTPETRPRP